MKNLSTCRNTDVSNSVYVMSDSWTLGGGAMMTHGQQVAFTWHLTLDMQMIYFSGGMTIRPERNIENSSNILVPQKSIGLLKSTVLKDTVTSMGLTVR